ncbi:hypothetical protein K9M48_02200 [Candidatus Gracilibacteria bacterium]|nr:hypothetical protein [Candidatus Gracilibacteria bacterium]
MKLKQKFKKYLPIILEKALGTIFLLDLIIIFLVAQSYGFDNWRVGFLLGLMFLSVLILFIPTKEKG